MAKRKRTTTRKRTTKIDVEAVRHAAAGRMIDVLSVVAGIPTELLDGKHHPCPRCDGKNRFRLIDEVAGAVLCNQCFSSGNGDFFAAVQWMLDCEFPAALEQVADYLGVAATEQKGRRKATKKLAVDQLDDRPWNDILAALWARRKPPITPKAVKDVKGCLAKHAGCLVVALPIYGKKLAEGKPVGWVMLNTARNGTLPIFGKDGEVVDQAKIKTLAGSKAGLIGKFGDGKRVIKTEGPTDMLALVAKGIQDGESVVCNAFGAGENPAKIPWLADFLKEKEVIVIGDNDGPGQKGAARWARFAANGAESAKNMKLPDAVNDLRDFLCDGKTRGDLDKLIDEAETVQPGPADLGPKHLTDVGNSRRLVDSYGQHIRHVSPWRQWLHWDGKRWKPDNNEVVELAKRVARDLFTEAEAVQEKDEDVADVIFAHAQKSEKERSIFATVRLARSDPAVRIDPNELDADPWLLNCRNGTVDLRTGKLRPHSQTDCMTKLCPTPYQPDAKAPRWEEFLAQIFGGDQKIVDFVQVLIGLSLIGKVLENVLPIFHGCGANGKSTLLNVLAAVIGDDYTVQCPPDLLMKKNGQQHPTELARLFGKRLALAIETEEHRGFSESLVKALTGGDRISCRRMREDFWDFDPSHTIIVACNHKPAIRGTDHAMWRRIKLVPFEVVFEGADQDPRLSEKLLDETPGILAWCVRGCQTYQMDGLVSPKKVDGATDNYRGEEDLVGDFLQQCCETGSELYTRASDLLDAYHKHIGSTRMTQTRLGKSLKERGIFTRGRDNTGRTAWWGIGLLAEGEWKENEREGRQQEWWQ